MKRFESIDHPSDIGLVAYGKTLSELFANAAHGMFSFMIDVKTVKAEETFEVEAAADDIESLLVNWLNELLFLEDTKHVLFCDFKIKAISDKELKGNALGQKINVSRHKLSRSIKAATYNQLKVWQENAHWKAKIIFDV